jgi:dihydropyrimidinase
MELKGWPVQVISRGRVVVDDGQLNAEQGSGVFQPCDAPDSAKPIGRIQRELDPKRNFGAQILF